MPKMKTRKAASKRFRITGTGKVRRAKANRGHLLTKRTTKRKRQLRRKGLLSDADEKRIKVLIA